MTEEEIFELKEQLVNHVVKTTQHVVMLDSVTRKPSSGGSGCLIVYRDRCFFITVQHVADQAGKETCIDLGKQQVGGNDVYNVGAMNFIDQYVFTGLGTDALELEQLKPLDIAYAEVTGDIEIFQAEMQIGSYRVSAGNKQIHFSETPELPTKDECYSFFGRTRSGFDGDVLQQYPKLVLCIEYDCKIGSLERFLLGEPITDPRDYQGTSGAPIISETGDIVAFVSGGVRGTNHLYGFSSAELKKYLDIYIDQHPNKPGHDS